MIKRPISYYLNKSPNKKNKSISKNIKEEENKIDNKKNNLNDNIDVEILEKIDKKLSKLTPEEQIIYLKEKINEIKAKNGNKSKLLFNIISKLISIQITLGDIAYNKGNYNLSLEKYKQCLHLNEPLPGCEWTKYSEWFNQRIIIFNSIALSYEKLNKKEQAIEYIKLSFNLEEKNNIKTENQNKFNDIFFLAGKQLILLGNYKEAIKYLLKVENNIFEEYKIRKILKRKKIDEKYDKQFIENNPDEYIYVLYLIYRCCLKQNDYDLGEKYYHRYEEIYKILLKIKEIKYPFKGINDQSDDELENKEKNINIIEHIDSDYFQKINDNFLINSNRMIDKAENKFSILKEEDKNEISKENNKNEISNKKKNEKKK